MPAAGHSQGWPELALDALSLPGRRCGEAKRAVVEALARQECCLDAQQIADRIRSGGRRVGTASVYRTLDLLRAEGLVQRIDLGAGGTRYERVIPGGSHHHHVICDQCGRLTAFEDSSLERAIDRLGDRLDHRVRGHDVLIRGECERCAGRSDRRRHT